MHGPTAPPGIPSMGGAPLLGQREDAAKRAVKEAIKQLSLNIYSQLAVAYISSRDAHQQVDSKHLQQVARHAQEAAQAFFVGLGVIEVQRPGQVGGETPGGGNTT